ncbi:acyl-CoA dehydrogenase family protein [Caenimonas aquaedulcis]|uniref:Acyl-CoA/acyl-ACP dehydrogenase n=1 Tax=Caenimonas aquaedulcis TaxID=2793270 RepID=A0A931H823_9BURK|nr:acyl-CoA dehydrogenase family protein [Caenimonas aquaedulcis]MBG9390068.1 acyl-CoA/acyl-ACP dehydrogenase [Caenimonas aquaedulcis]
MHRQWTREDQSFDAMLAAARRIATEVAAPQAASVDAQARFPTETLAALREAGLLSAGVPREFGGAGCTLSQQAQLCSTLAQACGSSAMVLAMHYIQLACIARHGQGSEFFRGYMQDIVQHQYLLASMTSEVGTFGETRMSICAVEREGGRFVLNKDATTGSYCAHADAILVTARRDKDAPSGDQVLVLVRREDCTLTQTTSWDTLGMRGTCSPGFKLESAGADEQVLPGDYADSSAETMVPYSHILWASLWWGIAADAVGKAANFVRGQARQKPGTVPPTGARLSEVVRQLQDMKQLWQSAATAYDAMVTDDSAREELHAMGWALRLNNLKISCSDTAPQLVHKALQIVGILGYKNDSPFSLGRQYRDSLSGSLMISNDRIAAKSAAMLMIYKDVN